MKEAAFNETFSLGVKWLIIFAIEEKEHWGVFKDCIVLNEL